MTIEERMQEVAEIINRPKNGDSVKTLATYVEREILKAEKEILSLYMDDWNEKKFTKHLASLAKELERLK